MEYTTNIPIKKYLRKEKEYMVTVQSKAEGSSYVISLPPMVAKLLEVKKGDKLDYEYNKETGKVEIVKVKGGKK
jgi:hypothetical protein